MATISVNNNLFCISDGSQILTKNKDDILCVVSNLNSTVVEIWETSPVESNRTLIYSSLYSNFTTPSGASASDVVAAIVILLNANYENLDFVLEVAKGKVAKHSLITKFGYNSDVDTGTAEDLWNTGGTFVAPTAARVHNITSSSANDTSAGTGARTVLVYGIDGSYARVTETVTMNGTSNVATVNSYLHIHLIQVTSSGSGQTNAGAITATAQTDLTVTATMSAGEGQTASSIFLVADGYRAYVMRIRARMNNSTANSAATVAVFTKPFDMGWQLKTKMGVNNTGSSFVELDYTGSAPYILPAKTWIKLRCTDVTNNNTTVEGEYDIILVQD